MYSTEHVQAVLKWGFGTTESRTKQSLEGRGGVGVALGGAWGLIVSPHSNLPAYLDAAETLGVQSLQVEGVLACVSSSSWG